MKTRTVCLLLVAAACRSASVESPESDDLAQQIPEEATLLAFDEAPAAPALVSEIPLANAPQDADGDLAEGERERREMLKQKTYVLVEQYLANARALEEQLRLTEAHAELEKARQLDPTNKIVRTYQDQIAALLGEERSDAALLVRSARERYEAQREQRAVLARNDLEQARYALQANDAQRAVRLSKGVVDRITWSAGSGEWGSLESEAKALLADAERALEGQDQELLERQRREAFDRLREEEVATVAQNEARIQTMLIAATRAFDSSDYEGAEGLALAVLDLDHHNHQAAAILDAAQDAEREYADRIFVQRRREEFNRWRNEMERVRIPNADIFTPPSSAHWSEINRLRNNDASLGLTGASPEEIELRALLDETRMDVDFDDLTITEVANSLSINQGVPVSIDPEVALDLDDSGETVNLRGLRDVNVKAVLNILVEQVGDELAWTVRNGRVYITTKEKAGSMPVTRVHYIQDLTFKITDFKGSNLRDIALPGEAGDDAETSIFNTELDQATLIEAEEILNLVRENIAAEDWDLSDNYNIDFVDNNNLLVIHTAEVQAQVAKFLDELRAFSTNMVTLESRFFSITDSFIEEIGTDLRGLTPNGPFSSEYQLNAAGTTGTPTQGLDNNGDGSGNPNAGAFFDDGGDQIYAASSENFFQNPLGEMLSTVGGGAFQFTILDDSEVNIVMNLVSKSQNAVEITAPIVSVYNTQRAFVTVVNQVSYVQGYEVDVATGSFIADPVIGVLQEGIVLDVRPTISYDRLYVTLDVQTTVAELERPFRSITTLLGPSGSPVTFSIPVLNVQDAQTTVVVPDGGAVVLGGFKHVRYKNRTAEAPWLADIPIFGFFFREKGLADEVTDLIIVIRAKITDFDKLR
ncbi:MAG: hypothetical protein DHS20C15_21960 [Planctomycetota bacterium]|nr:MAG: hypothetical protein DHS20C15_21960 [Planctomycetota bacterium]